MLSTVIEGEFEKVVGKGQYESQKAMHVGFRMNCGDTTDQYRTYHMYIYAPDNYVYVAVQEERIDKNSKRHIKPMELLCYHDSCWRDSIQQFIFKNRGELNGFQSLMKLFDWYDVLTLTEAEHEYLGLLVSLRDAYNDKDKQKLIAKKLEINPFDDRSVWAKRKV